MKSSLIYRLATLVSVATAASACVMPPRPQPNDPYYAPVMAVAPRAVPGSNGSLFQNTGSMNLFTDNKASSIGDIITVMLDEATVSQKSSNVGISKDSDINIEEPTILGRGITGGGYSLGTGMSAQRDFSGESDAAQRNNLRGNISVSVVDVWPNGTLVIRGEKWMTLNHGDEFIRISGLVRPDDVTPDNTILSTKVANARISYSGTGALAESQVMGWLGRFFNGTYWPY